MIRGTLGSEYSISAKLSQFFSQAFVRNDGHGIFLAGKLFLYPFHGKFDLGEVTAERA